MRLKAGGLRSVITPNAVFQFQTGAIKRTLDAADDDAVDSGFNSKLVRLKETRGPRYPVYPV